MVGVCSSLNLSEDNARILLLGVVLLLYMFGGAMLFHQTESEAEAEIARRYWALYHEFRAHLVNASVSPARLDQLLYEYGNATALGVINKRTRWDISGSSILSSPSSPPLKIIAKNTDILALNEHPLITGNNETFISIMSTAYGLNLNLLEASQDVESFLIKIMEPND
ncbi:unnamed protein product [Bemisia tabaci]|uniref:Uncharacterized protein n=1 Tax=Bemisia tabaci TaxID=7038 RepID=A0A9P0F2V3_BEMTA|nr:unnamed protein product [Bemisia tabaci]